MKTKRTMLKRLLFLLFFGGVTISFFSDCSSSKSMGEKPGSEISKWYEGKEWLNGLQLTPHESVNKQELYRQYSTNNTWWNEAFNFLKTTDLAALKPGTHIIDSGNVYAIVVALNPKTKEEVLWEAHQNFNDLQYIIDGKAQMGIAPRAGAGAKVSVPYDSKTDNENFTVTGEKYYDAVPGTFFIFSPNEIHRPAFKVEGYDSIKKIVIKVRVPK